MKKLMLVLMGLLCFCGSVCAESSVWVVRQGELTTYLGGTCHVLRRADYPLPAEFDKAYRAAENVVFEADPGLVNSPHMQQLLVRKAFYGDGTTLQDVLRPATYRLLEDYCRRNNLEPAVFARLKPPMAALTLLSMELQRHGIDQGGVDLHFYQRAVSDGKGRHALETVDQQVAFILSMAEGREDLFMEHSLADLERLEEVFDDLIAAWRGGDEATIANLVSADFQRQFPEIYRVLFTERNAAWLPAIEKYIVSAETELILVGVGHLVGDDGLLAMLSRKGYQVEKLRP